MQNKLVFKTTINDQEVEVAVTRPTYQQEREAQLLYNKYFRELVEGGTYTRSELERVATERKLWDEKKTGEELGLRLHIAEGIEKLTKKQAKPLTLKEARQIAIEVRQNRAALQQLIAERNALDTASAESQADNYSFNYLVSQCTVNNNTGEKIFANVEDYLERATEPVAYTAASRLAQIKYGLTEDFIKELPENAWLSRHKFVNDQLELIDKDGRRIDTDGNVLDDKGEESVEPPTFVDDDGNVVQ